MTYTRPLQHGCCTSAVGLRVGIEHDDWLERAALGCVVHAYLPHG